MPPILRRGARSPLTALGLVGLALTACAPWPRIDAPATAAIARDDFPALLPLAPILARAEGPPATDPAEIDALAARAAALRARAAATPAAVLTPEDRARLLAAPTS